MVKKETSQNTSTGENTGAACLHSFTGGLRETMVPESATAASGDLAGLARKLDACCRAQPEEKSKKKRQYKVTVIGNQLMVLCLLQVSMVTYLASSLANLLLKDLQKTT